MHTAFSMQSINVKQLLLLDSLNLRKKKTHMKYHKSATFHIIEE